jgi:L-lysine exporter family protein LysE/ArgO
MPLKRAVLFATLVSVMDISLSVACFFGAGFIIGKAPMIKMALIVLGSFFLMFTAIRLLLLKSEEIHQNQESTGLLETLICLFAFTWLNPQAFLELGMIFGAYKSVLSPSLSFHFLLAASIGATLWYFSLSCTFSLFRANISLRSIKILNTLSASVLFCLALRLLYFGILKKGNL